MRRAVEDEDEVCLEVVNLFFKLFGSTLCNLSVALLPRNGIILCNSIVSSLKDLIIRECKKEDGGLLLKTLRNNEKT